MRTKLALLLALARHPQLLILDEPSEGLDPVSIEELLQTLVAAAADGTTVFFSSHQIAEVERIVLRVVRAKSALRLSADQRTDAPLLRLRLAKRLQRARYFDVRDGVAPAGARWPAAGT